MFTSFHRALTRKSRGDDGGFALIYAVLIILVVTGLATAVLSLVVAQVKPTQLARKRQQTLNNAEAGIQAVVGRVRASTGSGGSGLLSALPQCAKNTSYAVISGTVDNKGDTYVANVYYLSTNPANQSVSTIMSSALYCSPLNAQPTYAYIVSAGASTAKVGPIQVTGDRTLHAVYQFSTSNLQVNGGRIKEYTQNLCWDAGSSPTVGSAVVLAACQAGSYPAQSWFYEPNLTIAYTGAGGTSLCVQSNNNTNGLAITLQTCYQPTPSTGNTYKYTFQPTQQLQEWGFNDNGHFASAGDTGGLNNNCIGTASSTPIATAPLILQTCTGGVSDYQAYNPDASVGAGAAGGVTTGFPGTNGQMINYQEFGRCIDLTGQQIGAPYDIDYPCKQDPDGTLVAFNQRFVFTAINGSLGTLSTNNGSGYYCLTANGFNSDGTSKSTNFQPCNGQATASSVGTGDALTTQQWTFTGNANAATDYPNSYNVKTVYNGLTYCLSIAGVGAGSADATWSTQILEVCNGSNRQKWNAPAVPPSSQLSGFGEDVDH